MGKEENLKPFTSNQSREQAKINGAKGGKKSGEVRRERKTMKEMLNYLLSKEITNNKGEKATTLEAMMTATIKKAIQGDVRACQFIRDTIGEIPVAKQEILSANLTMQKIYVTKDQEKQANEHIEGVINESI